MLEDDLARNRPSESGTFAARVLGFTKLFSTLIDRGVSLVRSLDELARQEEDATFRAVIADVNREIQAGNCLSGAMRKHPLFFSEAYASAIREGEVTGKLEVVLQLLADGAFAPGAVMPSSDAEIAAWHRAYAEARARRHATTEPEHLLFVLLGATSPETNDELRARGVSPGALRDAAVEAAEWFRTQASDVDALREAVARHLDGLPTRESEEWPQDSPAVRDLEPAATAAARSAGKSHIDVASLLTAIQQVRAASLSERT